MKTAAAAALALLVGACGIDELGSGGTDGAGGKADDQTEKLRIGQFNIRELTTAKLLDANNRQVNSAVELITKFDADILSINEIQFALKDTPEVGLPGAATTELGALASGDDPANNAARLAERVTEADPEVEYPHSVMFLGNSGFAYEGTTSHAELATRGFGEWKGRFNSALLSKHKILTDDVRVIHDYPWKDVPGNELADMEAALGITVPADFPIFEKALFIVPVELDTGVVVHMVLAHPVSSGFNDLNPYRNRDELKAIGLFLSGELPGVDPLPDDAHFIVIGDLNSDPEDGDGGGGINLLLDHPSVEPHYPRGAGGTAGENPKRNTFLSGCGRDTLVTSPASKLQLQLDYILPSTPFSAPEASQVYWPSGSTSESYKLTCYASDHRYVWVDYKMPQ